MIKAEIKLPLLNANEPEARVVNVHVTDRQRTQKGNILFTIETTKATEEIVSPLDGIIRVLVHEGDVLEVGQNLAVIVDNADEPIMINADRNTPKVVSNIRITKPARRLAERENLDLNKLPKNILVTEDIILGLLRGKNPLEIPKIPSMKEGVIIYGAGGHAKSVMEIVRQENRYFIVGIIDDDISLMGKMILEIPVLGARDILGDLKRSGVRTAFNGVGGILDIKIRKRIFDLFNETGYKCPRLIHNRATIESSAIIEEGVQVFANAYIGAEAKLHPYCMVNTNAVISHDCEVGEYSHIAPGALLAGHVQIGERTLVGMGVTTTIGVKIGSGARIGNGAIILADIPDEIVVQAGRLWTGG
jgi:sugar O-acyltransferase (sialic acid O-acetyltransferase NeuD family)